MGEDRSRGRAEGSPRLSESDRSGQHQSGTGQSGSGRSGPPVGRVYGRRRGRRLAGKKAELLGGGFNDIAIAIPSPPELLDPSALFEPRPRAVWLEIGFGGGEHLAAQALAHPDVGFIGCEPFINGVSSLLVQLDSGGQRNVRIVADDARLLLVSLPKASLAGAFLLFPDPWPKRRHEHRRFLAQGIDLLADALTDGGELRIATDHAALGPWMEELMAGHDSFVKIGRAEARPEGWPPTRYEAKAIAAGRPCLYLAYRRSDRAS